MKQLITATLIVLGMASSAHAVLYKEGYDPLYIPYGMSFEDALVNDFFAYPYLPELAPYDTELFFTY